MILLMGPMADPVLANICARLAARNADLMLVHPESEGDSWDITWSTEGGAMSDRFRIGDRTIHLSDIDSVYLRALGSHAASTPRERMIVTALWEFAESLPVLVVNRRQASHTNMSKPYQLRLIAQFGFQVPKTLITMVPEEARRFYDDCQGRVIYKSISAERSIVKPLTPEDFSRLEQIRYCPVQLQETIPGTDLRIHTVGDRLFATEVLSDGTDYRYAERENKQRTMRAVELEPGLQTRCLNMAKGLELSLSGIDLRRTPDGAYYCFEVNTSPGFTFFENHTGQRIGDALADLLCAGSA
ncbi:MAG: RimK domain-containing protein ATP-grasp [Nitrospira sp.]|nr:MAG: RimK domain-containing protein ATP-grasp [Nitrospira sp.]